MPDEHTQHEGTWLQWPHHYTFGLEYRNLVEPIWVDMTSALMEGEMVHIVAYNQTEKERIIQVLQNASIELTYIVFCIQKNDDVWVRDNGPMFVYDDNNEQYILDWDFNGWGNDAPYLLDNLIPSLISDDIEVSVVDLSAMVLEGGAIELDGRGTMIATRSSITHPSRNPNLTEDEIESYLSQNLGVSNIIWLDGVYGNEITDMHIDLIAKFANDSTIVTLNNDDLLSWGISQDDIDTLMNAKDVNGNAYNYVIIPQTQNNIVTGYGQNLGYKTSYCNYYIGNEVILQPTLNDPNDSVVMDILQDVYPEKEVVGIDCRNLVEYGGMIHCVTQQQPISLSPTSVTNSENYSLGKVYPNPTIDVLNIPITKELNRGIVCEVKSLDGRILVEKTFSDSQSNYQINISNLPSGIYIITVFENEMSIGVQKIIKR